MCDTQPLWKNTHEAMYTYLKYGRQPPSKTISQEFELYSWILT